jgi:hypothetical protein
MTTGGSERRQGLRQAICLPVKILFLSHRGAPGGLHSTSMKAAAPANQPSASMKVAPISTGDPAKGEPAPAPEEIPLHALALDVSPLGCQLELSGVAGRRFREDADMLPRLELRFVHEELRRYGAHAGRVRWSHTEGRGGWRVGLQLDAAFSEEELGEILWLGQPRPRPGRMGRDALVAVLVASAATALWYPFYRAEASEHERVAAQRQTSEDQLLACIAARTAEPPAHAEPIAAAASAGNRVDPPVTMHPTDAASPTTGEDLVRGLVERAFRADGGTAGADEE